MSSCRAGLILSAAAAFAHRADVAGRSPMHTDLFAFLEPVVTMSSERARLDGGEVIVKVLPRPRRDVAVFAASRLDRFGGVLAV